MPGIELGTAVVPTYPRHPAVLAQQALTAALALGGRLALGIGLSHQIVIEDMYGYSFDKPARHMREYLSVLLPLLDGEPAAFDGRDGAAPTSACPCRGPIGPGAGAARRAGARRCCRLAGQRADGTVLWMTGPATVRDYIVPAITAAAAERGPAAPAGGLHRCRSASPTTRTAPGPRADKVFAIYGQLPSYRAMLDREGAAGPGDVAIVGDEDAVAAQIRALADAGVTDFVAGEYGRGAEKQRTRALLQVAHRPRMSWCTSRYPARNPPSE